MPPASIRRHHRFTRTIATLVVASACTSASKDADRSAPARPATPPAEAKADDGVETKASVSAAEAVAAIEQAPTTAADPDPPEPPTPDAAPVLPPFEQMYWARAYEGKLTVDIIDAAPVRENDPILALAEKYEDADGITATIDANDPAIPPGFRIGDAWVVVTRAGPIVRKATAFGAHGGASESHFIVVLGDAPSADTTGIAWRGAAPKNPDAKLVPAQTIAIDRAPGSALLAAVKKHVDAHAPADAKAPLRKRKIGKDHVVAIAGRFPGGGTHLVALGIPLAPPGSDPEDEITSDFLSGLWLADATPTLTPVEDLTVGLNTHELAHVVDLDGDAIDEVVFATSYYEGSYTMLLAWPDGKPIVRVLTGDGA